MKHIIHKCYFNWEKEEIWLNDLAAKGLSMTDYSWCRYVFEDTNPGEYVYRIELLDHVSTHPESQKYLKFLEETGVEHVTSYIRWVYLRKKADGQPFRLYTDIPSLIGRNKRLRAFYFWIGLLELFVGLLNLSIGIHVSLAWVNLCLGAALFIVGISFMLWSIQLTRKIRVLKKEQQIADA